MSEATKANEKLHSGSIRNYISLLEKITISDDEEDEPENEYPDFDDKRINFIRQTLNGSKLDVRKMTYFIDELMN